MKVFPLQALICWESFSKPALVLRELRLWYGCYGTQRQRNENKSIHQWSGRYLYHTQVKCILWPMAKGLRYLNWWIPQETSSNMPSFKDKQILNYNRMDTDNPKQTWDGDVRTWALCLPARLPHSEPGDTLLTEHVVAYMLLSQPNPQPPSEDSDNTEHNWHSSLFSLKCFCGNIYTNTHSHIFFA